MMNPCSSDESSDEGSLEVDDKKKTWDKFEVSFVGFCFDFYKFPVVYFLLHGSIQRSFRTDVHTKLILGS